jgi:hypothetical protein
MSIRAAGRVLLVAGLVASTWLDAAEAATISVPFSGIVTEVGSGLESNFAVGQNFTGLLEYSTPGPAAEFPSGIAALYVGAVSLLKVDIGGYTASTTNGLISVANDLCGFCTGFTDYLAFGNDAFVKPVGSRIGDFDIVGLHVHFSAFSSHGTPSTLDGFEIPETIPPLSAWDETRLLMTFSDGVGAAPLLFGIITGLGVVAEPAPAVSVPAAATLVLLAIGVPAVLWAARTRVGRSDAGRGSIG